MITKSAAAQSTDLTAANHEEINTSFEDEGDESPRNYIKVFEVECYNEGNTEADGPTEEHQVAYN